MEPYHGMCPTCGAYMGRGDGNQCRACRTARFAGEGTPSGRPLQSMPILTHHQRLDSTQDGWVVTYAGDARSFQEEAEAKSWAWSFGVGCITTGPAVEEAP
jgi:hypothetical protein